MKKLMQTHGVTMTFFEGWKPFVILQNLFLPIVNTLSFFFWMFIHVENEYACCKNLPSFLPQTNGWCFLQEIGVPSLDRAGANVTGNVRLIVYNGAKLILKFIYSEEATKP